MYLACLLVPFVIALAIVPARPLAALTLLMLPLARARSAVRVVLAGPWRWSAPSGRPAACSSPSAPPLPLVSLSGCDRCGRRTFWPHQL